MSQRQTAYFTGDMGDIVAALTSIRAIGGAHIVIGPPPAEVGSGPGYCRESMKGARYEAIRPLLACQPYVRSVSWGEKPDGALDFSTFRFTDPFHGENLAGWQARHVDIVNVSLKKWLDVEPIPSPVVFARSARYWNPHMPWPGYADKYPDAIFVGTDSEHLALERYCGHKISHRKTKDLLELARVIAGCERFIGNQSCPFWIAAALDVPNVLEVCPDPSIQNCNILNREHFKQIR